MAENFTKRPDGNPGRDNNRNALYPFIIRRLRLSRRSNINLMVGHFSSKDSSKCHLQVPIGKGRFHQHFFAEIRKIRRLLKRMEFVERRTNWAHILGKFGCAVWGRMLVNANFSPPDTVLRQLFCLAKKSWPNRPQM